MANPTDLVKVRLQAEGKAGTPRRYDGAFDAYYMIVKQVIEDLRCTINLLMHNHLHIFVDQIIGRAGSFVDRNCAKYCKECYY